MFRLKNSEQLERAFASDGFVVVPDFLEGPDLDRVRTHKERFIEQVVPTMPASEVYYEDADDPSSLKQIQQLGQHDAYFAQLMESFQALAELLLGEPVSPQNLQYFNKPPGSGRPTPPHQDGFYFPITPNVAITLWLALDDVGPGQGRVRYVRGSHRRGLRQHERSGTLGFSQSILDYGEHDEFGHEIAPTLRAGFMLAHHSLTIHRAESNRSQNRSREALGFIYYASRCKVDERAGEAYQRQLARELETQQKIRKRIST